MKMSAANRGISVVRRLRTRAPGWVWFIGLAFAWGLVIVLFAFTTHDHCSTSDPGCVFHSYTLVQVEGPGILGFAGAPVVISMVLAVLLYMKVTRRSERADRAAWFFAVLSCLVCFLGLLVEGFVILPEAVLTVCAVATAPLPPDPNDPLARSGGGAWLRSPPMN